MEWFSNNYHWIFSGAGVAVIMFFLNRYLQKRSEQGRGQVLESTQAIGTNIKSKSGKITIKDNTISGPAGNQWIASDIDAGKGEVEISGNKIGKDEEPTV